AFAAGELAGEDHGPGIPLELALGTYQRLATFHLAVLGDIAVEALVFTTAPLVQVVVDTARQRAVLDVFGLVGVRAWHGAGVTVAAGPATGLAGQRDLVAGFEHVG